MKRLNLLLIALCISGAILSQDFPAELTEQWKPVPEVVTPGNGSTPPSDAIILFDGSNLDNWSSSRGGEASWEVSEGAITVVAKNGDIQTKQGFGDIQLHIEWRTPEKVEGKGQGRGNSGIFLQKRYELQVLDSYENVTYSNGQAGSVYKQHIPEVNASLPPGEWQSYDIIYTAPRFNEDGTLFSPARMTALHNGVLILNNVVIQGSTTFRGLPAYETHDLKQPIMLQSHSNPVSYRNIWVREL